MNRARSALLALVALALASATPRQDTAGAPAVDVVLVPVRIAPGLEPIRAGYAERLRQRLAEAGLAVEPGRRVRESLGGGTGETQTQDALRAAAEAGSRWAVLADLRSKRAAPEVVLRVYDVSSRELRALGRARAEEGRLAEGGEAALAQILPRLGVAADALPPDDPPHVEELAVWSRALRSIDAGELARAWREIQTHDAAWATRLRAELRSLAEEPRTLRAERARLLAARGEIDTGWELISEHAAVELEAAEPERRALLAAGEVLLERGELDDAELYFERALALEPSQPDAVLGLARTLELKRDTEGARRHYEDAAGLEATSVRAIERMVELGSNSAVRQARLLLWVGERLGEQLRTRRARAHLERAIRLEPTLGPEARERVGEVEARIGNHAAALASYGDAIDAGGSSSQRLRGVARAQRALGDGAAAERAYLQALELDPDDAESLRELGEIYTEQGQTQEAIAHLERAVQLEPQQAEAQRSLARAHGTRGNYEAALELYDAAEAQGEPDAGALGEVAAIHRQQGDLESARLELERAVELEPAELELRAELAEVYREAGDGEAAQREQALVALLGSSEPVEPRELALTAPEPETAEVDVRFESLLASFEVRSEATLRVAFLGLVERTEPEQRIRDWLRPRTPDRLRFERELARVIRERYQPIGRVTPAEHGEFFVPLVDALFAFETEASLDANAIARANRTLGTDAVFVARMVRPDSATGEPKSCGPAPAFQIELRMLSGQLAPDTTILANKVCLPGGLEAHGVWNPRAAGIYALLMLLVLYPFLRGWGTLVVTFQLPPRARALFSVRLSRRPRKIKVDKGTRATSEWRLERRLQIGFSRFEKQLQGNEVEFHWIPARRRAYYVTVRGPLIDSLTGELVGAFTEEKTVRVRRRRLASLEFDLRPKECPIEVTVQENGEVVPQACVALRGDPSSLRYSRGKGAFLYAGTGEHVLVAGAGGRLAEVELRIETLDPLRVVVDLWDEESLLFRDCPEAVTLYMESHFSAAADALERAGDARAAHRVRATALLKEGRPEEAARELEAAGELAQAAELRASDPHDAGSAELFEEAGEHARAAEAYREHGEMVAAARAYEQAHDYENAGECYRQLGDREGLLRMLENTGEFLEAGPLAAELGHWDRAIDDLKQIQSRHPSYTEACCLLADILADRGEVDLALEKFEEALERMGAEGAPLELQQRFAGLLEDSGRLADALRVWEGMRRRDRNYGDARSHIEELRERITQQQESTGAPAPTAGSSPARESRYEILSELGRGGMGVVYKARDKHLGRVVALKRLPDNLRDHPAAVQLFLREARSAAALNHPNVVTVYDAGQEGDRYFITMECLEGTPFDTIVKGHGALLPRDVALLGIQIASGLHYAHRNRIIHRDIKTSNLFYTTDRVVKIMDFGLAKMVEEVRRAATMIAGTPYYMSPEQATGGVVDQRADLYSFGVTLFQLVTGTVPFTEGDVTYQHCHTPPPDPRERVASVPEALAELILQLLAKRPEDRCASAGEVSQRLRQIAGV